MAADGTSGSTSRVLRCGRLVTGRAIVHDATLLVTGDRIAAISKDFDGSPDEELGGWVVPGFVDTQCHGGGGGDYAAGDPALGVAGAAFHLRGGTTTTFASLVTAELDALAAQIATLRPLVPRASSPASTWRVRSCPAKRKGPTTPLCCAIPEPRP